MDVIGGIIAAGVAVIAIAIITNVAGTTVLAIPAWGGLGGGGGAFCTSYAAAQLQQWNNTMGNVSQNSISGFSLIGISPLVLVAALIISILLGVFILRR